MIVCGRLFFTDITYGRCDPRANAFASSREAKAYDERSFRITFTVLVFWLRVFTCFGCPFILRTRVCYHGSVVMIVLRSPESRDPGRAAGSGCLPNHFV